MKPASGRKGGKTLFARKFVNLEEAGNRMHRNTCRRYSNDRRKQEDITTKRHAIALKQCSQ